MTEWGSVSGSAARTGLCRTSGASASSRHNEAGAITGRAEGANYYIEHQLKWEMLQNLALPKEKKEGSFS
ncbi:hypothetical protein KIL84_013686 [Mauremys mutica]|uniref:Uncharacterized protein n=1 Tax=Mauremys mutica TaxID=74926 RepID=A0A9D4AUI7_9SAUR|nr:hypothetical protein KIL84_013686 [Mauremys mutica]